MDNSREKRRNHLRIVLLRASEKRMRAREQRRTAAASPHTRLLCAAAAWAGCWILPEHKRRRQKSATICLVARVQDRIKPRCPSAPRLNPPALRFSESDRCCELYVQFIYLFIYLFFNSHQSRFVWVFKRTPTPCSFSFERGGINQVWQKWTVLVSIHARSAPGDWCQSCDPPSRGTAHHLIIYASLDCSHM